MCDTNTEQKIKDVVNTFVQKGYMFTAYDVTKFLRKGGERIRHHDVQEIVASMYANTEMGQYIRETKDVGAPVAPFVYYHPYSDLNNYDQNWVDTNPNQDGMKNDDGHGNVQPQNSQNAQSAQAPANAPIPAPANILVPPDGHAITKEGRLNIPADMVLEIADPHTALYVVKGNDKIVLKSLPVAHEDIIGDVLVNLDGRVRICKSVLCKISQGNLFRVNWGNGRAIEIAPY